MPRANGSLDFRTEHPKRVHVDSEMKEIRVKKATRDQLPQLESGRPLELWQGKVTNWPQRKRGQETRAGDRVQSKNSDVRAEQQSCEWRHKATDRRTERCSTPCL